MLEPVFDRLVQTGYASREGDTLSLTPAGLGQIETLSGLLRRWLVDHLAVAPGVEQQPDHQEFEAALQRLTDGVLVQRDWYEDLDELAPAGTLVAAK
ncbi:hypothetical protein NIIDMKKI_34070 [Mycobacterium kansasii]|uniref:Uncharacterized protein n=1 Tax=Mycobacterium kansasii TaxID=1768 RepID=A0A7G1IAT9_MYCKA|nr:hypothetical protein NIIDMKKI_34070 [Mycobacterium kansasii]